MRLLKLSLQHWRGIRSREITFAETVTLVEGPNEIGKSTIVEALQTLFKELDSSAKKQIRAIMPVGEDVGSRVEAEIRAGDYHFIYGKTYNRDKQTTLHILAPEKRQLTGREAHEAVTRMLEETVDLALWEALLIDQGAKIGLANLKDSTGLARALDEAAGSSGSAADPGGSDAGNLYTRAQQEYEKYFTPATGRPRYNQLITARDEALSTLNQIAQTLADVETNARAQEIIIAEVQRLTRALPELESGQTDAQARWQRAQTLAGQLAESEKALQQAQVIRADAERALNGRTALVANITRGEARLTAEKLAQQPLQDERLRLQNALDQANAAIGSCRAQLQQARRQLELARSDAQHLQRMQQLRDEQARLKALDDITSAMKLQLAKAAAIKVDDAALARFRSADSHLAIARSRRDAAATTLSISAHTELTIELDEQTIQLNANATHRQAVATQMRISLPDIADITVTPSLSVHELAAESADAEAVMADLVQQFAVDNLEAAVVAHQQRADALQVVSELKAREEEILRRSNIEEVRQNISTLQTRCAQYIELRDTESALPENQQAADLKVASCQTQYQDAERALDKATDQVESASQAFAEVDERFHAAQQNLAGLEASLADRRESLARARTELADEELEQRFKAADEGTRAAFARHQKQQQMLAEENPELTRTLADNAAATLARAREELQQAQQDLAVVNDRLAQAQANGRFEEMETAQRILAEAEAELAATTTRAQAAALLWSSLNRHRDAARVAYVRPLKAAIERLGSIVFGSSFEVTIDDDWSIAARTLEGKTLPYEDLSVGTREQLGILARLAAAQIVSSQGGVPLIIDDALGFSDPRRLESMGAAIAAAGRDAQIIILTCTPGRFMHVGNARVVKFAD